MSNLSPEKRKEMIEKIARYIADNDLVDLAEIFTDSIIPVSSAIGHIGHVIVFPWVYGFFGHTGEEYSTLIGLNFRETMPEVIRRARAHELEANRGKKAGTDRTERSVSKFVQFKRWFRSIFD